MDERLLDSPSQGGKPCQQQQGRTPNANYTDKWCLRRLKALVTETIGHGEGKHGRERPGSCGGKQGDVILLDITSLHYFSKPTGSNWQLHNDALWC